MGVVKEFDLDIKPSKLVKGQGLCKLAAKTQDQINEDLGWENGLGLWCSEALYIPLGQESWYGKLFYLLHHGTCVENLNPKERRALRLKSTQYSLINAVLFHINYDGVLLRCLKHEDEKKVLREIHHGPASGHFAGNTTTHKILRSNYYWPTLFRDAHTYARNCKTCEMSTKREKREVVPLQLVNISRPFEQWGLDFIGEIIPNYSKQHKYILTTTKYFMKLEEAIPLTHVNEKVLIQSIEQQLITRFGCLSFLFLTMPPTFLPIY
jgi:hypothetical protein